IEFSKSASSCRSNPLLSGVITTATRRIFSFGCTCSTAPAGTINKKAPNSQGRARFITCSVDRPGWYRVNLRRLWYGQPPSTVNTRVAERKRTLGSDADHPLFLGYEALAMAKQAMGCLLFHRMQRQARRLKPACLAHRLSRKLRLT